MPYVQGFATGYFLAVFYFAGLMFAAGVETTAGGLAVKALLWPQTFSFVFTRTVTRADADDADGAE